MARRATRREGSRRGSGCLGCLTILLGLVVACAVFVSRLGIPVGDVARELGRRALEATGIEEVDPARIPPEVEAHARALLSESQASAYDQILAGVYRLEDSIVVLNVDPADIDPAFRALMDDRPDLFWLDGSCSYTYAPVGYVVTVEANSLVPLEEVPQLRAQIETEADAFFSTIPADASEYDVARAAYEYVIRTTDYDLAAPYNQSMMSVFLGRSSVCAGYARAFQYLLQRRGIFCGYVEGVISDTLEDHAWNLARLDGAYTHIDVTWGDPTYQGEGEELLHSDIIYDYLCLTTEEICRDRHAITDPGQWPDCTVNGLDYYRREGLFFDAYDEAALANSFWRQEQTGGRFALFKFGSDADYRRVCDELAEGTFIYDALLALADKLGTDGLRYTYTTTDALRIVKFFW